MLFTSEVDTVIFISGTYTFLCPDPTGTWNSQ